MSNNKITLESSVFGLDPFNHFQFGATQYELITMKKTQDNSHSNCRPISDSKSSLEGVALPKAISPRKRGSTSMVSEYLVLTDVATSLSTYVQNREFSYRPQLESHDKSRIVSDSDSESSLTFPSRGNINDDAKLLLNLKEVVPETDLFTETNSSPRTISLSLSFEAQRHYEEKSTGSNARRSKSVNSANQSPDSNDTSHTFSFSCPSLSLHDAAGRTLDNGIPSQLFSRSVNKRSSLNVSYIAENLASNVMQSFITALEWRTKVWIMDISKSLSSKFNEELAKLGCHSLTKKQEAKKSKGEKSSVDNLKEKLKKSQEARVINALSKTRSTIIIHDVRTTFFVLEKQPVNTVVTDEEEKKDESDQSFAHTEIFRPLKKRRTVTDETSSSQVKVSSSKYTLSHTLNLDSRFSVSTSCDKKITVSLQTPGTIHGTFIRNEGGDVMLVGITIDLDTQNLAYAIEQKSRHVVRSATEEFIISPVYIAPLPVQQTSIALVSDDTSNGGIVESSDDEASSKRSRTTNISVPFTPRSTDSYGYGDNALVTPNEREYTYYSDSSEMPPPPPRFPIDGNPNTSEVRTNFLNPRRVSPTTADSNAMTKTFVSGLVSPTPTNDICYVDSGKRTRPPLVSPNLNSSVVTKKALDSKGPYLPTLVDVAGGVHPKVNCQ